MTEILVILIVAAAAAAVAYPALRHRDEPAPAKPGPQGAAEKRVVTEEERLLEAKARVLGALREIDADRDEGNISDEDYERLKRGYEAEAAAVLRRLDALGQVGKGARPAADAVAAGAASRRRGVSTGLAWGFGVVVFVALVGALLAQAIRPRGPDGSITGNDFSGGGDGGGMGGGGMSAPLVPVDIARVPDLQKRIAADSNDVDALNELAHIYISTQQFREAAGLSMRALRVDNDNAQAMAHLGVVLWASGDLDAALEAFNHSITFDPKWHEAYLFKGLVLFTAKQDFQGAVETWERYLEVVPPGVNTDRIRGMLEGARRAAAMGGGPR